jgi:hypothetical protein
MEILSGPRVRAVSERGKRPLYYITQNGRSLAPATVQRHLALCKDAKHANWYVVGVAINEDYARMCEATGVWIPSACGRTPESV